MMPELRPGPALACAALLATATALAPPTNAAQAPERATPLAGSERDGQRWQFFLRENEIDRFWIEVSERQRPSRFALTNVALIAMSDQTVARDQTVIVSDGYIDAVGPSSATTVPPGILSIDVRGAYLMPGLADMHVHSLVSNSQPLLNLANGVTTVRDMGGFAWMLAQRNRIAAGELLAPNMYLTGHILNGSTMGFYATPVATPAAGRRAVRDQVAAGYDFIKVHNTMAPEVYAAITTAARRHGIDVVGHVPQGITVATAIAAGQRTLEHLKGYILDHNLQRSEEDYLAATQGQRVWNCPTFYTYRVQLRGEEARRRVIEHEQFRYVAPSDRLDWIATAALEPTPRTESRKRGDALALEIFKELLATDARFLAGTDSGGGMPFMIPGFGLHEELAIMQEHGLKPDAVLASATTEAAAAMRRDHEFGTLVAGKRADLLLLDANPLENVRNLKRIRGVAVAGRWLDRAALDEILDGVAEIYAVDDGEDLERLPTEAEVDALIGRLESMRAGGFVFRDFDLGELSRLLDTAGLQRRAATVRALRYR